MIILIQIEEGKASWADLSLIQGLWSPLGLRDIFTMRVSKYIVVIIMTEVKTVMWSALGFVGISILDSVLKIVFM